MNRLRIHNTQERLPEVILYGSIIVGVTGFADSIANTKFGVDLGIRNFLPEPLDLPDHGMSMAMGAVLADYTYSHRLSDKVTATDFANIADNSLDSEVRHSSVSNLRLRVAGAVFGGILAASTYIGIGEVGSEVMHTIHNNKQAQVPISERKPLPLGHFDPLDLMFGIGAGVAVVKLKGRRVTDFLDKVEPSLPPEKLKSKKTTPSPTVERRQPAPSKRYTPPKNRR